MAIKIDWREARGKQAKMSLSDSHSRVGKGIKESEEIEKELLGG